MSRLPILHHPGGLPTVTLAPGETGAEAAVPVTTRRRLVLAMAAFTTLIEALAIADLVPSITVGALDLNLSVIPALGLAIACGQRLLGRSARRSAAVLFGVVVGVALPLIAVRFAQTGRLDLWISLLVSATGEELIYRLAIPAVIAFGLRAGRVRADYARIAGLALAGVWFVLLPGHREQMTSPASAIPFVAFALLAALLVYRSGSILPMALGHAVVNMMTVLMWNEAVAADARGMALACVLGLLVLAYGRPRRLTVGDGGGLLDTRTGLDVAMIDLRDSHQTSITLANGRTLDVDGNVIDAATHSRLRHPVMLRRAIQRPEPRTTE